MKAQQAIKILNMLGSSIKRVLDEQGITYKSSEWKILKYKPPNI